MKLKVKYVNLKRNYKRYKNDIDKVIKKTLNNGDFILRDDVKEFEKNISSLLNVKYAVGVNSGTDALFLSCKAAGIGKGDEVITVGHTFIATLAAIYHCGARPILIDIKDDFNINEKEIEQKITTKTKAIIPVHLNGRSAKMDTIVKIAKKHKLKIIEDACQSIGAKFKKQHIGTFGDFGCFSLHPMKSLNCAGDGGYIVTNSLESYNKLLLLRNHGQTKDKKDILEYGYNSRLDNLQAAIVNVKLKYLKEDNISRRNIAQKYNKELKKLPIILPPFPKEKSNYYDVYNSYVIRTKNRDELLEFLLESGIEVFAHMKKPLYKYKNLKIKEKKLKNNDKICKEILSLPIYPELKNKEVDYIINRIKQFFLTKL